MNEPMLQHRGLRGRAELEDAVGFALDEAHRLGATAAEASASADLGLSVNVRLGEVETVEHHRDQGLGITLYFGNRKGSASTADLKPEALREAIAAAARIARYTAEDPCAGLAPAELMARGYPELDLDHPWEIDAEGAIAIATVCEAAARAHDPRITNSEGASLDSFRGHTVYGNTHGFIGGYAGTRHSLSCSVIAEDAGGMQRDYWYDTVRDATRLAAPEAIGLHAATRALGRLGARRITTRQAPVLFAADLARGLIGHLVAAVRGAALYRKASFLLDALDTPVFPGFVALREEPHLKGALGSAPFDAEGVATRPRALVEGGVLRGYVLDSYSARRLGTTTTGNAGGVHNLTVDGATQDLDGLLREMGTGLYVTELIGHGVNAVTGDYSRGAAGFWVEKGEIVHPVEEITVAGNLREMFIHLRAIGTDTDRRGNIRCGSLLVDGMTVAGG